MNKWIMVSGFLFVLGTEARSLTAEENYALANGASVCVSLQVVDDRGVRVADASVMGNFHMNDDKGNPFKGRTDTHGIYIASGRCVGDWHYVLEKDGYYRTSVNLDYFRSTNTTVRHGRWQPYGMTNTVVLKRKVTPVAICVASSPEFLNITIPVYDVSVGFDLEKCDWLPPYGGGSNSDIQFKYELRQGAEYLDVKSMLTMSFTNKFGGAYVMEKDLFSSLPSVYGANTNARFVAEYQFVYDRKPDKVFENSFLPINKYLVFRCRTKVDKNGNLVISHYGKIYGNIDVNRKGRIRITYYFNPNENDPNLEADTTRNLLNPRDLGFAP